MTKTILITGATDGIGLEAAKILVSQGHRVLLHGRNPQKLEAVEKSLSALSGGGVVEGYVADLSRMADVELLAQAVAENHANLDVLINNAGVYKTTDTVTSDGLDVRFAVNAIAPYLLTQRLISHIPASGRVVNVSSAAQSPVSPAALMGRIQISDDFTTYAQSKLTLTMWSHHLALSLQDDGPAIIAVNPGSLLGSKMVKEAFGVAGSDIRIGAKILVRAALTDEFAASSGKYFDNDRGQFAAPHPDGLSPQKCQDIVQVIEGILAEIKS
ncbi:SDR family NAD(P)-dependent oxidoreductase [Leptothoe sp. PORK10 BA2]|uniref:SDR family NAD(P)-dependent oxidoreductase n=1 Tax=Leptothoe sp. PORK10 BA2 TaxID=3110254 RepID=UPI002B216744|nr:SDR family NAD(P)-dependent oxidoreductase [Leptothoe sp. PORK10 BA2]MEA5466618.1 SDR family NAD(P)-dependent oxidoreductase [Leptothoe sp. PORK10 BA2]